MSFNIENDYSKFINDKDLFRKPLPIFYDDFEEYYEKNPIGSDLELIKKLFENMRKRTYPIGLELDPEPEPVVDGDGNVALTDPKSKFHEFIILKIKEKLSRKRDIIKFLVGNKSNKIINFSDWKAENGFMS